MLKRLISSLLAIGILSGCTSATPSCSSSDAVDLVLEISNDELIAQMGQEVAAVIELSLDVIRTQGRNEDLDTYECAADLVMVGPGGENTLAIEYTVESTDETDEFYVTVYGL